MNPHTSDSSSIASGQIPVPSEVLPPPPPTPYSTILDFLQQNSQIMKMLGTNM